MNGLDGAAVALADAVRRQQVSAEVVVAAALSRAHDLQARTNAFQSIDAEGALVAAREVDRAAAVGRAGALAGVPVAVKDNLLELDRPCTCGSRVLEGYVGSYDATVIARLRAAGAVVVARTNLDEFGMGSTSERCAWGLVRHPRDAARSPGGSSGGSAVACADGAALLALGSDTGGSVRQPASHCGVVGIKPTYGRISRFGLVGFASSLDHVGLMARTVGDVASMLTIVAGSDPRDATSMVAPALGVGADEGVEGVRVGVPRELLDADPAVRSCVLAAADRLARGGARVEETSIPWLGFAAAAYAAIAAAEASSNLARFDGMRFGRREPGESPSAVMAATRARFGDEVRRRVLLGTYLLSEGAVRGDYARAVAVRGAITAAMEQALLRYDVLLSPTAPTVAPRLGAVADPIRGPIDGLMADRLTIPASLAGLPAVSVPCGEVDGLPVGAQVIGRRWEELTALRVAAAIERLSPTR
jgi:aspartyl-tRNA(Asn)/glutamyl-tRNA(Gln) amidotransferase subunit A